MPLSLLFVELNDLLSALLFIKLDERFFLALQINNSQTASVITMQAIITMMTSPKAFS